MKNIYRGILKKSLILTIKNKYFWFFGLFASLIGISSEYDLFFRSLKGDVGISYISSYKVYAQTGIFSPSIFHNIIYLFKTNPVSMLMILFFFIVFLILFIFLIWLSVASQVAIVNNSAKLIVSKNTDFKDGLLSGTKNFWPVFGMNILIKIVMIIAFLLVSLPVIFSGVHAHPVATNGLYILFFVLLIPIGIVLSFIIKYSIAYVVIKREKFISALQQGFQLFKQNWLVSIEMAFILFVINILATLATLLIVMILLIPVLFLAFLLNYVIPVIGFWLIFIPGLIVVIATIMLGSALITTFYISSWTTLFIEITGKGVVSKISRMVSGLSK